jgi:RNA polymerase sigma factor (sigma-70 family)
MNKDHLEFQPHPSMVDIVLNDIDEDLKILFPDIDVGNLMNDLGNDLRQINDMLGVLENEYKINKKEAIEKWQKGESIPEPISRALDDLSKTAWNVTLLNARYILNRIKKVELIAWEEMNSQQRSDMLSIGLMTAHKDVLNHDPDNGITSGEIFQQLKRGLSQSYLSMHEKASNDQDWSEIDEIVEDKVESDNDLEILVMSGILTQDLDELISDYSDELTPRTKQVLALRYLYAKSESSKPTYAEIAKEIRVTRERVRQIHDNLLRKLRHPTSLEKLRDFWER